MEQQFEHLDVLTKGGKLTGTAKRRDLVHRDGDYHRAVHVWIYAEATGELLLQKRAESKDSWPGMWDISSAGHISAGKTPLATARIELEEELGLTLPEDAFEFLFVFLQECVTNNGTFINNEYNDVYLVTTIDRIPEEAFTLQDTEVSAVKYISVHKYIEALRGEDPDYVPYNVDGDYKQLFEAISKRYNSHVEERIQLLKNQLSRYVCVPVTAKMDGLTEGDMKALVCTLRASKVLDHIFYEQVWFTNPDLRRWLEKRENVSELDSLKLAYFRRNKCPWSLLDENEAYLSTADSPVKASRDGLRYRAAFPSVKPPGASFYPPDMTKEEFDQWKSTLGASEEQEATSFFTTIRRSSSSDMYKFHVNKYSDEYSAYLREAANLLHEAAAAADNESLKRLLRAKADAFLSNDYYESDIAWIELDSPVDVTIGPYETYEDELFGYKATFEAFIGVRDELATQQLKLFSKELQNLEDNLPLAKKYKSKDVKASPIRVIQLLYNSGDVAGPQTVAFNLPNDERIVKDRGSAMVMLKNVSEAKFDYILLPIARVCIAEAQRQYVDFDAFFTHTICHECCHGIGPHTIVLPDGKQSTVRLELQELHSALEEAKADIVGLWALQYLLHKGLLNEGLAKSMYVSFLAGCFRSMRFGLEEAHGKGQALQFNWIFEKGGFCVDADGFFSVAFDEIQGAVTSLCTEIMTIQARGDKASAKAILDKYGKLTPQSEDALARIRDAQVPVDIAPSFDALDKLGMR